MLALFDAIFLAATLTSQAFNIVARSTTDVKIQENISVYAVEMKQQAPMWADKCLYDGVMVQYARDWEETQESTGIVLPAEPDKPLGYALILTKEKCPGKAERDIFSAGSKFFYPLFGKDYVIREGHRIDSVDYASQRDDMRPKWMPQVLRTIESESTSNPAANSFITEMKRRADAAKVSEKAAS